MYCCFPVPNAGHQIGRGLAGLDKKQGLAWFSSTLAPRFRLHTFLSKNLISIPFLVRSYVGYMSHFLRNFLQSAIPVDDKILGYCNLRSLLMTN
ncbi:hypothetical protein NC652_028941 [Populus alba x Populus x berolinensis]|nr:hypothetical protein NC652_028941 [Populus alba x Populus x berolinensis]